MNRIAYNANLTSNNGMFLMLMKKSFTVSKIFKHYTISRKQGENENTCSKRLQKPEKTRIFLKINTFIKNLNAVL